MSGNRLIRWPAEALCAVALLLPYLPPPPAGLAAEEFRWRVEQGDVLTAGLRQEMTAKTSCSGQERTETTEAGISLRWEVLAVDDAGFTVRQTVESVTLRMTAPATDGPGTILIDTSASAGPPGLAATLHKELMALKGLGFTAVYRFNGSLVSVTADDAALERIRGAPATSPLHMLLSPEGLTRLFGSTQLVFPDRDLQPGDSWSAEAGPPAAGGDAAAAGPESLPAVQGLNWRYEGPVRRDQRDLHRFTGTLPPAPRAPQDEAGQVRQEVSALAECLFDAESGIPHSAQVRSRITITSRYRDLSIQTEADSLTALTFVRQ